LGIYAQIKLSSAYGRYSRVGTSSGLTGAQAAREILDRAGLYAVAVQEVGGHLTDHYDPTKKALFLSSDNYHGRSIAAVGVAAHEAGHALQHQAAYAPLQLRMALVPITQFATSAVYGLVLLSFFLGLAKLAWLGVAIFGVITLFQLITLPVEFNASSRARDQLLRSGVIGVHENAAVSRVLNAAAMTYVAAMVTAVMQLLHWFLIARASDRD
jgi:Zn-dependent membrane protease YugP